MKDEAFDIIPLIVLLGILVSLSMGIMIPLYRDSQTLKYDVKYDKTVTASDGYLYDNTSEVEIGYSYEEIILMLGKQSYMMPSPRRIDVCGSMMGIEADTADGADPTTGVAADLDVFYVPDDMATILRIKQIMQDWCTKYTQIYGENGFNLQFEVRFTTGDTEDESDDCYAVFILAKNNLNEIIRLKCLENGYIDEYNGTYKILYREG